MGSAEIETSNTKMILREDGISHIVYQPEARDTLETAIENVAASKKVHAGKKRPMLIDTRNLKSQEKKARDYFASDAFSEVALAIALLIDSGLSKVIGNFYMGLNKPKTETRLFTSENDAIDWLNEYL